MIINTPRRILFILFIAFFVLGLFLYVMFHDYKRVINTKEPTISSIVNSKVNYIEIKDMGFVPSTLMIHEGEEVIWMNKDLKNHTVTSASGKELGSSVLNKGENYTHIFNKEGSFEYLCSIHTYMKGKVIVEK